MVYLITYDLKKPGQDYSKLYDAIKSLGEWIHPLTSTWIVSTSLTSAQAVYDRIRPYIDDSDRLLVVAFSRDHQGWLDKAHWDWINKHL